MNVKKSHGIAATAAIAALIAAGCGGDDEVTVANDQPAEEADNNEADPTEEPEDEAEEEAPEAPGETEEETTEAAPKAPSDVEEETGSPGEDDAPGDDASATGPGSVGDPVPLGEQASVSDSWSLTVESADLDAEDAVAADNDFQEPPPDGHVFVLWEVTITNDGDAPADPFFSLVHGPEDADGVVHMYEGDDSVLCTLVDSGIEMGDIEPGESVTGQACVAVPEEDVDGGLVLNVLAPEGLNDEAVYFALN